MATPTHTLIDSATVSSSVSSVTFSSIPQTYKDLILVFSVFANSGGASLRMNGDSSTSYRWSAIIGNGSNPFTVGTSGDSKVPIYDAGVSTTVPAPGIVQLLDYSSTSNFTQVLARSGYTTNASFYCGHYINTSAVTSLTVFDGSFTAGATFYLYGVEA